MCDVALPGEVLQEVHKFAHIGGWVMGGVWIFQGAGDRFFEGSHVVATSPHCGAGYSFVSLCHKWGGLQSRAKDDQ